jgi:hypothetical protein
MYHTLFTHQGESAAAHWVNDQVNTSTWCTNIQGFQNNPAAAGVPAGGTKFTAGYCV